MTRSKFPFHLRSFQSKEVSACGNYSGVSLSRMSIKRVDCKNCLKIIANNVETRYFKPVR